ncbi:MAG TPA: mechanosensitive ion channel domain-containing protein [Longimicrobium sp.]|nr:mechanosensitive ion channel domain-containing protein [Longimicrobium sp.]
MIQGDADAIVRQILDRLNQDVLAETGGRILGAFVVAWLSYWALKLVLRRIDQQITAQAGAGAALPPQLQRTRTLLSLLRSVGVVLIVVMFLFMTLNAMGVQLGPLLAGAGVVGLAVSFGAQSLVKDVISGLFMLFENQFGVGDVIRIEGVSGAVEQMTLRVVVLRDVYGVVHIVPNGEIKKVSNLTRSWARVVLDVGVAYREDPDRVMAVLREVGDTLYQDENWRPLLVEPVEVPGIENLADSAVTIRVMAKTLPLKQWDVARELRRRIKVRFDQEGIEIPFPHQTVYWGEGQQPAAFAGLIPPRMGDTDPPEGTSSFHPSSANDDESG